MKSKFLTLLGIVTLFTSCSSDDSSNEQNSIIGTWKPVQEIFINSSGNQSVTDYNACQQTGRINILSDSNFTQMGYYEIGGNCELEYGSSGNWQVLNGNILRIVINGQIDNGFIDDYLIIESTSTTLKIDADLDSNSIEQEIYVFEKQ